MIELKDVFEQDDALYAQWLHETNDMLEVICDNERDDEQVTVFLSTDNAKQLAEFIMAKLEGGQNEQR